MFNRRQLIQTGLALSAVSVPALSAWPAQHRSAAPTAPQLERFVFDNRFSEAAEAAREAARRGVALAETSGDLMDLWYHDLDISWRRAPMSLAGVTTPAALFVLQTLAADHRMRVVYRGEHTPCRDGRVHHALTGAPGLLAAAAGAPEGRFWMRLAHTMTQSVHGAASPAEVERVTRERASNRLEPLVSWIIAPRGAVAPTG